MKKFTDYVSEKGLNEIAAYDVGASILGRSTLDSASKQAMEAAFQAFEIVMAKAPQAAVQFLNHMAITQPEIKSILQQNGLENFNDAKMDMKKGAMKGRRVISKGLGNVSPEDVQDDHDVVSGNSADSFHNPLG